MTAVLCVIGLLAFLYAALRGALMGTGGEHVAKSGERHFVGALIVCFVCFLLVFFG